MPGLQFINAYHDQDHLRRSFNELAGHIFGISFESWYQDGYWTDKYIPFSIVDGDKIVANVSVNKVDLVISGQKRRALQIGTVMTHPAYRDRGLSRRLMNEILEEYEDSYDLIYLFANHNVLEYYPKFGFKAMEETQFAMDFIKNYSKIQGIRKLSGLKDEDLQFIHQTSSERQPVSHQFGSENTQELLMFYAINVFHDDIYYLEDDKVIVICKNDNDELHLFDIIGTSEFNIESILNTVATEDTRKIVFHFTPDCETANLQSQPFHGSEVLFVKNKREIVFPSNFKHPITAQA
ncbi:GNAT family N-acetyltransferase [Bacillus sp. T33-2]|uniref:GNAT family N-acetyltransferase n=1 Tax=Bacillus sp. T33-2 TaxID=2054168 RepID=UPI000C77C6ED|nr:GNAT family N-acetyltransferase [Bacillus sp. T33-2]PLR96746.1 GNAT family N-acetyltransferase [Bacillus sp. T33-2]